MNLQINYYQILNVDKKSNSNIIKKSYYKLSMKNHPDKGGDAVIFSKINEAYEALIDDTKREEYDKKSRFGANYDEINELLDYEFNNLAKAWKDDIYDEFKKKELLNVVIRVDEPFDGTLEYERWMICKKCDGSGKDWGSKIEIRDVLGKVVKTFDAEDGCDFCEGSGLDWRGGKCGFCFGQGKVGSKECESCSGEKRIMSKMKLKGIKFPDDKDEIKIECLGNYSKDAPGRVGHLWIIKTTTKNS